MYLERIDNNVIWLGLATFACSMLFVWQGLDFSDMGYWLTSYQQFYMLNEGIPSCWLTTFIGHWVGVVLGGSVLAYRLTSVVIVTLQAIIAYHLLASQLGRSHILAAMVLLTVFFTRGWGGNLVEYNSLTALFYLAGAALLFYGLVGNRKLLVVLAGVLLGANIFVRFPNVLGITLMSAVWLYAWANLWTWRKVLVESAWFLSGFVLGVALIWGLIVLNGHEAIYLQGIQEIFGMAQNSKSHHSGSGLLKLFISDHVRAFAEALFIIIILGWIASWCCKQKNHLLFVVVLAVASLLVYFFYIRNHWRTSVPGLCYSVLLLIVYLKSRKDPPLALLAFIAGFILLLAPLGSNNGISNSVAGMMIALPLTLAWLWTNSDLSLSLWIKVNADGNDSSGQFSIDSKGFRVFAQTVALALLIQSLLMAWRYTYCDSENRFAMTYSIPHPLLVGQYTTKERAVVVAELLDTLSHFAKPGDEVLAYNMIPTVHFLTETRPWLGNAWPDIEAPEKIAAQLRQKELVGARLPCIVRATFDTYSTSWPMAIHPPSTERGQGEIRDMFATFEQRHGYVVEWSNGFFEILTTAE